MKPTTIRLTNIDMLRGIVMILMCIDHARDYTIYHPTDPMTLTDTPFSVWLLRILAHLCAPTFIFLAGISAWMSGRKKDKKELSIFLLTRGLVLCLLEITLVNWGWSFNPTYHTIYLQVIWAIGIAMISMAALIHISRPILAGGCIMILLLHNIFCGISFEGNTFLFYLWSFLLQKNLLPLGGEFMARTTYPVLPVIALMGLGYIVGKWYTHSTSNQRKKYLRNTSLAMLAGFVLFRIIIGYGDPSPIDRNNGIQAFILSVMNTTKYPLSLDFILLYLSVPVFILSITDGKEIRGITVTLGRVPMFFYIIHLYILHSIILIWLLLHGETIDMNKYLGGIPTTVGYPLEFLWFVVPFTVLVLYLPCKWYYNIKKSRKYKITSYI